MEAKNASLWNIFNAEKYVLKIQKHSEIKQLDSSNRVQKWEPDNVPARKYYQKQCLSVGGARHVAVQKSAHHVSNWGRTTPALMQPSIASLVSFRLHHISSYRPDHYLNFNFSMSMICNFLKIPINSRVERFKQTFFQHAIQYIMPDNIWHVRLSVLGCLFINHQHLYN